jgi:hypothetical protein
MYTRTGDYTNAQMQFLTVLADCESLLKWLLSHKSTAEFNRLLQVSPSMVTHTL